MKFVKTKFDYKNGIYTGGAVATCVYTGINLESYRQFVTVLKLNYK
jgi:hypothetical protein